MDNQTTTVAIPPTTEYTVIFPSSAPTIGVEAKFDSSFYAPNLTDGRASKQEIIQVLSDIESTLKPWADKIKRAGYYILAYVFLSFFAFLYFLLTAGGESLVFIIGPVAFILGIILSLVILIFYFKNLDAKMRPKCQETIDRHNQSFLPRGLRWHLPCPNGFPKWIELWKDYSQPQGFVNQQPINVPQYGQNYSYQQGQSGQNGYVPLGQC